METTLVTLATGRVIEVEGAYEAVRTFLAPRQLSETGKRELKTTQGPMEVATAAVLTVEPKAEAAETIGFARALETA